jgi:hypothetical protein
MALAFGRFLAMLTICSLQFAVRIPMQIGALRSWCPLGCPDICTSMSFLWLVSAEVFGNFFEHWWASRRFLWTVWTVTREPNFLSYTLRKIFFLSLWLASFWLASVKTSQQPVRMTSSDRSASNFSFQIQIREDWCNRPDDVDSSPDTLIHKARIAIQISTLLYADWNLNSPLYLCLVLRCSLIVLSVDYTCVFWNWLEKKLISVNFP